VFGAVFADSAKFWVRCGDGAWIEIVELQPAGKRRMSAEDFLRGNPLPPDARTTSEAA
jgi:methionyl-tRNA formyltransferase